MTERSLEAMRRALAFDAEALLVREPGTLLSPRFIGSLHRELRAELGAAEAWVTLLQIGFLNGLRDASRVAEAALAAGGTAAEPEPALLPIRFRANPRPEPPGSLELTGGWPQRDEAAAHLAHVGEAQDPACPLSAGYTSGWLSGLLEADILALEHACAATGGEACRFVAREAEVWRALGDERAVQLLGALPFDALREFVGRRAAPADSAPGSLSGHEPVIHIWGPVMVIPFSGHDEAMAAIELIGRDPEAARVSVVVVDLTGTIVDEAFGATSLERIIDCVEAWGADCLLAGVSPLAREVVAGLERQPLVIHKDLNAAIAGAFQIAEAQRRVA